ncbi:hypothetical protein FQN50_002751 [Emmonsiellopsis sp. PD_5]|nr:hypothetical protein FQN50_002751 [Emmonsiellopsis sp. PD_5]
MSSNLYPAATAALRFPLRFPRTAGTICYRSTYSPPSLSLSSRSLSSPSSSSAFSTSASISTPAPPTSAATIASDFLSRFQSIGPQTRTQTLDANQLHLLSLTLNRSTLYPGSPSLSNAAPPASGTPVPPGHHLVYFTPAFLEGELGPDGTDASYNPEAPFTRRMWAGGEVRWPRGADGKPNLLRVGQEVRETTRMLSAEAKIVKKTGEEMVVVGVEKVFENENGVAVVDRRNWVFREALKLPSSSTNPPPQVPNAPPLFSTTRPPTTPPTITTTGTSHTRTLTQTAVTLFRFSALTFNAHKIHYSLPWAQAIEGHRGLVVHGPINLISILDLWRDVRGGGELVVPESITYRATSPLYAEEEYRIVLEEEAEGKGAKVNIYAPSGVVAMKADIVA